MSFNSHDSRNRRYVVEAVFSDTVTATSYEEARRRGLWNLTDAVGEGNLRRAEVRVEEEGAEQRREGERAQKQEDAEEAKLNVLRIEIQRLKRGIAYVAALDDEDFTHAEARRILMGGDIDPERVAFLSLGELL